MVIRIYNNNSKNKGNSSNNAIKEQNSNFFHSHYIETIAINLKEKGALFSITLSLIFVRKGAKDVTFYNLLTQVIIKFPILH